MIPLELTEGGVVPKLVFNPPPGWEVPEPGWLPDVSWQPPESWPPLPAGWPLFYVQRTVLTSLVWMVSVMAAVAGYAWVMAVTGTPLGGEAYGLVLICLLAFSASARMGVYKRAPLTKWTWLPNRSTVTPGTTGERTGPAYPRTGAS